MDIEGKAHLTTKQSGSRVILEFECGSLDEASRFYEHICYELDQGTFSFQMFNLGASHGKN